jgi:uncharacterized membrane protein
VNPNPEESMTEPVAGVVLIVATMAVGLMAGVFGLYANTIMRGLGRTDDRTFVGAFQSIDRAIINPLFLATFFAALILTGVAGVLHVGDDGLAWIVVAFVLYLVGLVITFAVNVPLNDAIKAAGEPDAIDVAGVRARFDEARWNRWNLVRALLTAASFACLACALALRG